MRRNREKVRCHQERCRQIRSETVGGIVDLFTAAPDLSVRAVLFADRFRPLIETSPRVEVWHHPELGKMYKARKVDW